MDIIHLDGWTDRLAEKFPPQIKAELANILPLASQHQDIGESLPVLVKLLEMLAQQGGSLAIVCEADEQGKREWFTGMHWDREDVDSDMAGAAAYSAQHATLTEATDTMAEQMGLVAYSRRLPPLGLEFRPQPTEPTTEGENTDDQPQP